MIEMFDKELTMDQLKTAIENWDSKKEITISKSWVYDLIDMAKENERLKERLQISPQGDDKIDELEEALNHSKFQLEAKANELSKFKTKTDNLYRAVCKVYDTTDDYSVKEELDKFIGMF